MSDAARPATADDLKNLLVSLDKHGVDYLLIGGYALAAHGYRRATIDIDVMVAPTIDAGRRMKDALMALPDQAAKDIDPAWFEEGKNIRVADEFVVDIMLNVNGLEGVPARTISLEGLLLTKQTMREKDVLDRLVIERALDAREQRRRADRESSPE